MTTTTYAKLRSGDWGVRVEGGAVQAGQVVTVTKRNGCQKTETIEKVIWSDGSTTLCAIKRAA